MFELDQASIDFIDESQVYKTHAQTILTTINTILGLIKLEDGKRPTLNESSIIFYQSEIVQCIRDGKQIKFQIGIDRYTKDATLQQLVRCQNYLQIKTSSIFNLSVSEVKTTTDKTLVVQYSPLDVSISYTPRIQKTKSKKAPSNQFGFFGPLNDLRKRFL